MLDVLADAMVAIILQYTNVSSQHTIQHKQKPCIADTLYFNDRKKNCELILITYITMNIRHE